MCLQSPMYKVSQLRAAEPRGGCKTRYVSCGENTACPTCGEPGNGDDAVCVSLETRQTTPRLRRQRGAHAPQLASKKSIGLFFRQLAQPVVKNSRLRRFSPVTIYFEEI